MNIYVTIGKKVMDIVNKWICLIKQYGIRILCLMLFCLACVLSVNSKTSKAATIMDMQKKFPNGAYWNHVVQSGHGYSGYIYHVGPCNNPDGYTWVPCDTHTANAGVGGHDCNEFDGAVQCCGFVKKLASDLYGSMHTSWGQTSIGNAKIGDIIHYYGRDTDATNGHWAMIIGCSGNVLTLGECNYGSRCRINWGRTLNVGSVYRYVIYSAPWAATYSSDTIPPVISNVRVAEIDDTGYSVYCEVTDNVGVNRVQFPTWPAYKSSEGCPWPVGGNAGNTWACRISYATFDNYKGLYHTHIYAYDAAGNYAWYAVNFANQQPDNENPVISNIQIYNIDDTGYTIACKVTDNVGVDRVQFPTWPSNKTSEGCPWFNGEKVDNTWTCRVSYAAFDNYKGLYTTHIYAYDTAGNWTCYKLINANKVKGISTPKPTVKPVANSTSNKASKSTANQTVKNNNVSSKNTSYQSVSKPGLTTIKSCKAKKNGRVDIRWYKIAKTDGYEIQYFRKKITGKKRSELINGGKTKEISLFLKPYKRYYIRIRPYRYDSVGNRINGNWSNIKKVRTKK